MAQITLGGNPIKTNGTLPELNVQAKNFNLTAVDLTTKSLEDYKGKKVVLNIFPSVDTGTCAASVRNFNKEAANLDNTAIICVSKDLPFAMKRFCGAEGLDNVESLSDFKSQDFSNDYGLRILDGPLEGLLSRAVVVLDENGKVIHTEQVAEIADEPNYEAALKVLK